MKQIFPKEIIESTIEVHQFKHSKKSKIIYTIILTSFIIIICSLPLIKIDIYTSSHGLIKPNKERLTITSLNSGKVIYINLKNNNLVKKGDTLLVIDNSIINEKLNLSKHQIEDIDLFINDLNFLINHNQIEETEIKSHKYKKEYLLYNQKLQELYTRRKKIKRDYDRSKTLFEKGVIAKVEFEGISFDYNMVISNLYQLKLQQINTWQASLTEYKRDLLEVESITNQLEENKSQFIITAPITGTLIGVKSIAKGSFLNAGEAFANISPNTTLLVECFIDPQYIGLLKLNDQVSFQIDTYNYNQWGLATGKIIEIGKDIEFIEKTSVFKVLCHINEESLSLKNGFKGKLKKGMTLNAQFKLAERTVLDLLYDKIDDWVNPSQKDIVSIN